MAVKWGSDGGFYRARVLKIDEVLRILRVHFVDFGNTLTVGVDDGDDRGTNESENDNSVVMRLPPGILHRKFRAIECHLADVVPAAAPEAGEEEEEEEEEAAEEEKGAMDEESRESGKESSSSRNRRKSRRTNNNRYNNNNKNHHRCHYHPPKWSRESRDFFIEHVKNKSLVIQVKSRMLEGEPIVDLWDTTPFQKSKDILLNELLVRQGFARYNRINNRNNNPD